MENDPDSADEFEDDTENGYDPSTQCSDDDLNSMRKQYDIEIEQIEAPQPMRPVAKQLAENVQKYIESMSITDNVVESEPKHEDLHEIAKETDAFEESGNDLIGLDPTSREYRYKMVEKVLSDVRSVRSYSTSASTIAPSVIKSRIVQSIDKKAKQEERKRCMAKGESNATTRGRKENKSIIKECPVWDY